MKRWIIYGMFIISAIISVVPGIFGSYVKTEYITISSSCTYISNKWICSYSCSPPGLIPPIEDRRLLSLMGVPYRYHGTFAITWFFVFFAVSLILLNRVKRKKAGRLIYKVVFWSDIIVWIVPIIIASWIAWYLVWETLNKLIQDWTNTFWVKLIVLILLGGSTFSDIRMLRKLIRLKKNNETNRRLTLLTMAAFILTFTLLILLIVLVFPSLAQ